MALRSGSCSVKSLHNSCTCSLIGKCVVVPATMMKTIEMPQATATQHIQSTDSAQYTQGCCACNSYFYECQISIYCLQLLLFPCLFLGIIHAFYSFQIICSTVEKCLKICCNLSLKSVAFPSIGAGNLKYPEKVVARCLLETTASFLQRKKVELLLS